jgi:hypothetical protein
MLRAVKVPVLLTHHFRNVDADSVLLMGALSDVQAARVRALLAEARVPVDSPGPAIVHRHARPSSRTSVDRAGSVLAAG